MLNIQCKNCGAAIAFDEGHRTTSCPYCASPQVVQRPPSQDLPNPHFVLGFALAREAATELARRWLKSQSIFTVSGVKKARIETIQGLYLPVYLYSATAHSHYAANIGENYQETEHYWTRDSNGKQVRRSRTVTKTEWRQLQGQRSEYVSDVVVTASRGVPNAELDAVEPFDMRALHRYTPGMISGWLAEEPSLRSDACLEQARAEGLAQAGKNLSRFMPGDRQSDLRYETRFSQESLVLLLAPLWVLALKYHEAKPPFRLLINGQTGRAWGKAPRSWIKIALAVTAGLGLLGFIVLVFMLVAYLGGSTGQGGY